MPQKRKRDPRLIRRQRVVTDGGSYSRSNPRSSSGESNRQFLAGWCGDWPQSCGSACKSSDTFLLAELSLILTYVVQEVLWKYVMSYNILVVCLTEYYILPAE